MKVPAADRAHTLWKATAITFVWTRNYVNEAAKISEIDSSSCASNSADV